MMNVTVLSGAIREFDVKIALLCDGIVALETTRPEADVIYARMVDALDIDEHREGGPMVLHQSVDTSGGGWTPYLVYFPVMKVEDPKVWKHLIRSAIDQWASAGVADKFVATVSS